MGRQKNVLLIVVDQWRGDTMGVLGHPCIRTPHLDALCADGVTFRQHFTQAAPCGPGRASLLTGLYMMNHRVVQNSVPLDMRHTNLALEMRQVGYEPALVGYTTTTPDPRVTPHRDPRFRILGSLMHGWYPVGAWEPEKIAYFNWLRTTKGFDVPKRLRTSGCRSRPTARGPPPLRRVFPRSFQTRRGRRNVPCPTLRASPIGRGFYILATTGHTPRSLPQRPITRSMIQPGARTVAGAVRRA